MVRARRKLPNTFIQLPKFANEEVIDKGPTVNCSGTRFRPRSLGSQFGAKSWTHGPPVKDHPS